jgi:hypothetical protein
MTSSKPRNPNPVGGVPVVAAWTIETEPPTGEVTDVWIGALADVVDPVETVPPPFGIVPVVESSATVTVKVAVPMFPAPSVAWQVTCVAPSGKVAPDDGEQVGVSDPLTRSVALAEYVTPVGVCETTTTPAVGTVTIGAVVSCTLTWKVVLELFECESVAVHVTNVVPSANVDPELGEQLGVTLPSTRSLAVGAV